MAKKKSTVGRTFRSFMSGGAVANEVFIRRLPVLLFGAGLMMVYIAIGFQIQARHSEMERLTRQLKELRTISVAATAQRMELTRRETIERLLIEKNIPLVPTVTKPIVLK